MNTPDPLDLLKRIIDAYDTFTAAEIDLEPHEIEPFRAALSGCIGEADTLVGCRKERGRISFTGLPPCGPRPSQTSARARSRYSRSMATMATMPTKRYCGRTTITIARRDDGSGYECTAAAGRRQWNGLITLPIGLADDGSPAMFDQLAKMTVARAVAEEFENWLILDMVDSGYAIRRRADFDAPSY